MRDVYGGDDEWGELDLRVERDTERERLPRQALPRVPSALPRWCVVCGGDVGVDCVHDRYPEPPDVRRTRQLEIDLTQPGGAS